MKNVLIIDGYNMIHRCRFEWGGGLATTPNKIIYNFFRTLRSTIARDSYDLVYFVTEGRPSHRISIDSSYKANRVRDNITDEEAEYWSMFSAQKALIINLIKSSFPIVVAHHPEFEGDDVIYALIKNKHSVDNVEVVSSDTDFIQIINEFPLNVKLFNPISKVYRKGTSYDYVSWKAMVGDKSDNIKGVPRIGKKTAEKILSTPGELVKRLGDLSFKSAYDSSYELIKLSDMKNEFNFIEFSDSLLSEGIIRDCFELMNFAFSQEDDAWNRYIEPFKRL